MEKIKYLYGASGHCKVVVDILKSNNIALDAILDDTPKSDFLINIPVKLTSMVEFTSQEETIISIGNNAIRKKIAATLKTSFFKAVHKTAIISSTSTIDDGSVIMAGVIINADAKIGRHCIINTGAIVEHDCVINDFADISPNVALAGNVVVGEGTHIGIGASVIQGIKIGKWATIGAGSVIIKDIPDFAVVVGNPGKIIKYSK